MTAEWNLQAQKQQAGKRQFYAVSQVSNDITAIQTSDVIFAIDGKFVTNCNETHRIFLQDIVSVTLLRNREVFTVQVPTSFSDERSHDRVVNWCGAYIDRPNIFEKMTFKETPSEILVWGCIEGSPFNFYGIPVFTYITQVNNVNVHTLEEFEEAVRSIPDKTHVNLKGNKIDLFAKHLTEARYTVKTDYHYFPTNVFLKKDDSWYKDK